MFQSTPPAWGGDVGNHPREHGVVVSIHATRVGWRLQRAHTIARIRCFNPRHPRGVATLHFLDQRDPIQFQSTPPAWGGDSLFFEYARIIHVSIHATRVGWRRYIVSETMEIFLFQSTPPAWGGDPPPTKDHVAVAVSIHATRVGWRRVDNRIKAVCEVSIHATRVGWRQSIHRSAPALDVSIHATRVGWRLSRSALAVAIFCFNPRHPRGVATQEAG